MTPAVIITIAIICSITLIAITLIISRVVDKLNKPSDDAVIKRELELEELSTRLENFQIDFSKTYLEYIQYICGQVSIIKFREFRDTHDISKATKKQIADVAQDVANNVKDAMQFEKIDFTHTKFTEKYLQDLIIQTVIINIKNLTDNAINNME